jgi:ATP-dependent Clp protease adaptor protein ClpS
MKVVSIEAVNVKLRTGVRLNTEVTPELDQEVLNKLLPPYKVILHNDDYNTMDLVVLALVKSVPSLSEEEAVNIMWTAHSEGSAVVVVCPQEAAEYYQSRISSFGLTCTIELDE